MTDALLRAGVIGLGSMGRHHVRILREIPGIELVALVDATGDRFEVAGGLPVLGDVGDAVDLGLDIAVIAVPTAAHEPVADALVTAGVNVLVEKPLATTVESCRRLMALLAGTGAIGAVGHVERFNPATRALKQLLGEGAIGAVRQIATRRFGPFTGRITDVGVGLDLGSHDADLTAWLGGSPYERVAAMTWTAPGQAHEGVLDIQGTTASGVLVRNSLSWHSPLRERVVTVFGDDGVLVADTGASTLHRYTGTSGEGEPMPVPSGDPLRTELEAFRDAVLGRDSAVATFADGAAAVAVVQTALDSAASGLPVEVPPTV